MGLREVINTLYSSEDTRILLHRWIEVMKTYNPPRVSTRETLLNLTNYHVTLTSLCITPSSWCFLLIRTRRSQLNHTVQVWGIYFEWPSYYSQSRKYVGLCWVSRLFYIFLSSGQMSVLKYFNILEILIQESKEVYVCPVWWEGCLDYGYCYELNPTDLFLLAS